MLFNLQEKTQQTMRMLSWDQFNSCVESITHACSEKELCGVYGFPRGGLCLAVALSHSLNIPFLDQPKPGSLVVDDVYETGMTLSREFDTPEIIIFVWMSKVQPDYWNAVEVCDPHEWLIFPWENCQLGEKDEESYRLSRN